MGHQIEYFTYTEKKSQSAIMAELNSYAKKATWQEGGHGLNKPIRFIDKVMPDYQSALDFLSDNDKGWYDQLAVKYKEPPRDKTSKKLVELKEKLNIAYKEWQAAQSKVVAKDFKSDFIGCKHCNSKINRKYIKSNLCPVCMQDMRSDTIQKKIAAMHEKVEKLRADIRVEEMKLSEKYGKICWVVKIEYHV